MTEVPEHLLRRSRERRAALGLGGDDAGGGAAPAESASGTDVEPAAATPAAAAAPAAAAPAEVEAKPPEPLPPYVEAALRRKRVPYWAMPVLAFLPIWAIIYAGSLSAAQTGGPTQLTLGAETFASRCATCHGSGGGGGVGRPLSGGEVLKTFPDIRSQIEFVSHGSEGAGLGQPYGNPDREGGPHVAGTYNGSNKMPAFHGVLTDTQLLAVVRHERETLSGEKITPAETGPNGTRLYPNGKPMLSPTGELLDPEGNPLLDTKSGSLVVEIAAAGNAAPEGQVNGQ